MAELLNQHQAEHLVDSNYATVVLHNPSKDVKMITDVKASAKTTDKVSIGKKMPLQRKSVGAIVSEIESKSLSNSPLVTPTATPTNTPRVTPTKKPIKVGKGKGHPVSQGRRTG